MKIHHVRPEQALASLNSRETGLSRGEAALRLAEFGPNRVERVRETPLWLRFVGEFTHFFALILWLAAALAFTAEALAPGGGMKSLGWAILGVIGVNGIFSFWQEYRAERTLAALEKLLPHQVKVLREGATELIAAETLVPGDVVTLQEGDDVPADCRLIEAYGVRANLATVTGESLPKAREAQACDAEDLLQARNILLAGTSVVSGEAKAVVFATGAHTEFGKIAHLTQTAVKTPSPLQKEITHASRVIVAVAISVGLTFFLVGQFIGLSFWANFTFAIGIIVAFVPEGLLPTVTLSLAIATQRMAKRNALIRHLPAVEALGAITVICTDKTGTLTENRMAVRQVFLDGELAGAPSGATPAGGEFLAVARLCHSLKRTRDGQYLGDPMEIALAEMGGPADDAPRVDELPFDTDRKRLSVLHRTAQGLRLYVKGAPETVLPLCSSVLAGGGRHALDDAWRQRFLDAQEAMTGKGLRVLAFAFRPVGREWQREELENELVLLGLVGLEDPPRPEVPEAIRRCRQAGIRVVMVTGDHPHTALAIAREIGLVQSETPAVLTGDELRRLSDIQLQLALGTPEILFARLTADQKLRIVTALKGKREIVAVTGDGVNDAPALKKADIGIAMGICGTEVAREAADMVLLDDNFASIVAAVEEGRAVFDNLRKFLTYILSSNIAEAVPFLSFVLFRIPLPLTIIQILAVDLGSDLLPALSLGAERPRPEVMQRPPRPRRERLLNRPLLARAYLFLGAMEAVAAMAAFFFVLQGAGWRYGEPLAATDPLYLQATTATLTAIILMQVANVFLCRSDRESIFTLGLFSNRLVWAGIAAELALVLAINYTAWGNWIYATAPSEGALWLFVLPFALGMLALEEGRKWLRRRSTMKPAISVEELP